MVRQFICTEDNPIAVTDKGKLRGYLIDGIYTFKGIRYAKAKRFHMPEEVDAWDGVIDVQDYGFVCPNPAFRLKPTYDMEMIGLPYENFLLPRVDWKENEHCQFLNVWTPGLHDNKKRPVMFWIHGGGYTGGSSIELTAYEGENLSRFGDVVVVSVNHRLNFLGYLDLSEYGDEYANSGNAGMADIVMALKWVQKNISEFGGDPDNVTLFGQSGGGGKITTLMQMPAADNLYHKVIIQSGVMSGKALRNDKDTSNEMAAKLMKRLGLTKENVKKLELISVDELADTLNAIAQEETGQPFSAGWAPVPGEYYVGYPTEVGFRKETEMIPMIVGSNFVEFIENEACDKKKLEDAEKLAVLEKRVGKENALELKKVFEEAYPELDYSYAGCVDVFFRNGTVEFCKRRILESKAPVYNYVFTFESPYKGGKMIGHSGEIAFPFQNAGTIPVDCKEGVTERLQNEMAGAWVSFAKEGKPELERENWKKFTEKDQECMAFGDMTVLKEKRYDEKLRILLSDNR